ncbi:MAG: metalloregulator ArsR/SmtB family transcription factor [Pseudomonadota bacterium]
MDGDLAKNKPAGGTDAEEQARLLKVLGNPWRLQIVSLLAERPRQVGEIEEALELGQAYVSQQLARLRTEGVVEGDRSGRAVQYRIVDARIQPVLQALRR